MQSNQFSVKLHRPWGTWLAQSVKCPTSGEVMISQFVSSSPASGSVLTAQSLEPASDSVSLSLSLCPSPAHTLSLFLSLSLSLYLSLSKTNIKKNCFNYIDQSQHLVYLTSSCFKFIALKGIFMESSLTYFIHPTKIFRRLCVRPRARSYMSLCPWELTQPSGRCL